MQTLALFCLCIVPLWALPLNETRVPLRDVGHRIISGTPAYKGQFPWQAALTSSVPGGQSFCGASLISDEWILTAAHCVSGAWGFTIYLGTNSLTPDADGIIATGSYARVHPQYNAESIANDVALVRLQSPVSFTNNIYSINLPTSTLGAGVSVEVSGWGKTSDAANSISNILYYVVLSSISNNECSNYYGSVAAAVLCALGGPSRQSTCSGDSGGALVTGSGRNAVQVGVVSFVSSNGCESGYPSGYSRVHYFRDWIRQETGL